MKKITTLFLLLTQTISLSGCGGLTGEATPFGFASPMPPYLRGLPQGDDPFSVGFRDGCYNMLGAVGYGAMRFYDAPRNPEMITHPNYRDGYEHGDSYCLTFANKSVFL